MAKIIDITGTQKTSGLWKCAKCGTSIYNDHGWVLDDSSVICRNSQRCFSTEIANKLQAEKNAGIIPPWRKQ